MSDDYARITGGVVGIWSLGTGTSATMLILASLKYPADCGPLLSPRTDEFGFPVCTNIWGDLTTEASASSAAAIGAMITVVVLLGFLSFNAYVVHSNRSA